MKVIIKHLAIMVEVRTEKTVGEVTTLINEKIGRDESIGSVFHELITMYYKPFCDENEAEIAMMVSFSELKGLEWLKEAIALVPETTKVVLIKHAGVEAENLNYNIDMSIDQLCNFFESLDKVQIRSTDSESLKTFKVIVQFNSPIYQLIKAWLELNNMKG